VLGKLTALAVGIASKRRKLLILTYHRVVPELDPLLPDEPTAVGFSEQLRVLGGCCTVLSLTDAVRRMHEGTLPAGAVSLTFDDGYANNHDVALPVLQRFGMPATFFITTAYTDGGLMWNDKVIEAVRSSTLRSVDLADLGLGQHELGTDELRVKALAALLAKLKYLSPTVRVTTVDALVTRLGAQLPPRLMLDPAKIRALRAAGMEIGAHTVNHPILATLDRPAAEDEIVASKTRLEQILGEKVRAFAYPNGRPNVDYTDEHVECVRAAGYEVAVSTTRGCAIASADVLQLPRTALWARSSLELRARLVQAFNG
jgi:peptidoglycan/xylan/chitin deacetylase (PgdA/CDA1 family)